VALGFAAIPANCTAITAKHTAITRSFTAIPAMLKAKALRSKAIPVNFPATAVRSCRISASMAEYSKRIEWENNKERKRPMGRDCKGNYSMKK
jgi:hypothetical protein